MICGHRAAATGSHNCAQSDPPVSSATTFQPPACHPPPPDKSHPHSPYLNPTGTQPSSMLLEQTAKKKKTTQKNTYCCISIIFSLGCWMDFPGSQQMERVHFSSHGSLCQMRKSMKTFEFCCKCITDVPRAICDILNDQTPVIFKNTNARLHFKNKWWCICWQNNWNRCWTCLPLIFSQHRLRNGKNGSKAKGRAKHAQRSPMHTTKTTVGMNDVQGR